MRLVALFAQLGGPAAPPRTRHTRFTSTIRYYRTIAVPRAIMRAISHA